MSETNETQKKKDAQMQARQKFGKRLRLLRDNLRLTGAEVANIIGLSHYNFVSQIERAQSRIPQEQTSKWAYALGFEQREFAALCLQYYDPDLWTAMHTIEIDGELHNAPKDYHAQYVYYQCKQGELHAVNYGELYDSPDRDAIDFLDIINAWFFCKRMFKQDTVSLTGRLDILTSKDTHIENIINRPIDDQLTESEWKMIRNSYDGLVTVPYTDDAELLLAIEKYLLDKGDNKPAKILPQTFQTRYRTIKIPRKRISTWEVPIVKTSGKYIGEWDYDEIHIDHSLHMIMQQIDLANTIYKKVPEQYNILSKYWSIFDPKRCEYEMSNHAVTVSMGEATRILYEKYGMEDGHIETLEDKEAKEGLVIQYKTKEGQVLEKIKINMAKAIKEIETEIDLFKDKESNNPLLKETQ